MKRIIALLLLLTLCFSLCACGANKKKVEKDLQGGWEYTWYASAVGMHCFSYYEFENGTVTHTFIRGTSTSVDTGTYEIGRNKISIHLKSGSSKELSYSYDGDTLTLVDYGDGTISNVYTKFY